MPRDLLSPRDPLSIVIPVRNGQSILTLAVGRILDVMPDLAGRFELLIVDDGSNDGTEEAAWDLAARYMQVDYVRHPIPLGMDEAIRSGLQGTSGEYVLICEGSAAMAVEQMATLWRQRSEMTEKETIASFSDSHHESVGQLRLVRRCDVASPAPRMFDRKPRAIGHRFRIDRGTASGPRRSHAVEVLRQKATSRGR